MFKMRGSHPEHLLELDGLRVVALMGVVAIHSMAWIKASSLPAYHGPWAAALDLFRFCVPAFVFASGLVLYYSHGDKVAPGAFLRRRALRVALPWFAWVPVFALLQLATGGFSSWGDLGSWIAYGGGHLYFLVLIAQLYFVFLVLPRPGPKLIAVAALGMAIQVALGWYRTYLPLAADPWSWPGAQLTFEEAPFYLGYFLAGCLAGAYWHRLVRLHRLWPLGLVAVALAVAGFLAASLGVSSDPSRHGTYTFLWPAEVPLTLTVSVAALWLVRTLVGRWVPISAGVAWISRHSLGLYIIHPIFLAFAGPRLAFLPDWARATVLAVGALAFAALVVILLGRTRWTALAIGESLSRTPPTSGRMRTAA